MARLLPFLSTLAAALLAAGTARAPERKRMSINPVRFGCAIAVIAFVFTAAQTQAGTLYGLSFDDHPLYVLDEVNGTATAIGTGVQNIEDITASARAAAYDSSTGTLYGSYTTGLWAINTTTGVGSLVGSYVNVTSVTGLAYDPNSDILYGVSTDSDVLVTINRATGEATKIGTNGTLGFASARSLAYDPNTNTLYGGTGFPDQRQLISINTTTGVGTAIGQFTPGDDDDLLSMDGLTFDYENNILYGTGDIPSGEGGTSGFSTLFTINTSTGEATAVAPPELQYISAIGAAFAPTPVAIPEPGGVALAGLGILGLMLLCRRRFQKGSR